MKLHRLLVLAVVCSLFAGCSRPPQLTVINKSSSTLSNIVASGSGFSRPLSALAPGAQQQLTVSPRGESGLKLAVDAAGRHYEPQEQGYFEGGYNVSATVAPDFTVSIESTLPRY